jgi:hypothetical protein
MFGAKKTVLALVGLGILALVGFGYGWFANAGQTVQASSASLAPQNEFYILMSQAEKAQLDEYRTELAHVWAGVTAQKQLLDTKINPTLEAIFGTHDSPLAGTLEEHEQVHRSSPVFQQVRSLQIDLAKYEAQVLAVAQKINAYESALLAKNAGKQLDKTVNNAFNGLRNKVAITLALIADVYNDDPPCPECGP